MSEHEPLHPLLERMQRPALLVGGGAGRLELGAGVPLGLGDGRAVVGDLNRLALGVLDLECRDALKPG